MKKKWIISADSGFDITDEMIKKYDIRIQPVWIMLGDKSGKDCDFTQSELYEYANKTGTLPKTASLSPEYYQGIFEKLCEEAEEVYHISLSSGITSCNMNAKLGAEGMEQVHIIDSLNLSSGFGLIVLHLAKQLEKGATPDEAAASTEAMIPKVDTSFVLDTLEYMKMGGRCSAVAVFGANLLKIKPQLEMKDGKLGVTKKYRGNLSDVLKKYIDDRLADLDSIEPDMIFVTHSGIAPEIEKEMLDYVAAKGYFKEVVLGHACATIATHCGPNCLGVLFVRK